MFRNPDTTKDTKSTKSIPSRISSSWPSCASWLMFCVRCGLGRGPVPALRARPMKSVFPRTCPAIENASSRLFGEYHSVIRTTPTLRSHTTAPVEIAPSAVTTVFPSSCLVMDRCDADTRPRSIIRLNGSTRIVPRDTTFRANIPVQ